MSHDPIDSTKLTVKSVREARQLEERLRSAPQAASVIDDDDETGQTNE